MAIYMLVSHLLLTLAAVAEVVIYVVTVIAVGVLVVGVDGGISSGECDCG